MDVQDVVRRVQEHRLFLEYRKIHPRGFLAHVFLQEEGVQVGFFDGDRMTSFVVSGDVVDRIDDQEVLQDGRIVPLELDACVLSSADARRIFFEVVKKEFPRESPKRFFMILQQAQDGPMYNMTALTVSMKTINVKISAVDGVVKKSSCEALVQF